MNETNLNKKVHEITQSGKFAHEAMMFARIVIGCVFIYHSLSKFGSATPWYMTIVGVIELIGGIFVLLGAQLKKSTFLLGVIMIGAIFMKMFVWGGSFSGRGGWEFDLVILALLALLFSVSSTKYRLSKKS